MYVELNIEQYPMAKVHRYVVPMVCRYHTWSHSTGWGVPLGRSNYSSTELSDQEIGSGLIELGQLTYHSQIQMGGRQKR